MTTTTTKAVKTMQQILEDAQAKFRHADITTDQMAVIGEGANWEEQVTLIPNPQYAKELGVERAVKLQFQKMLGQARVYKHHKLRLWYVANGDNTGVWVNKPSDVDIFCRWN